MLSGFLTYPAFPAPTVPATAVGAFSLVTAMNFILIRTEWDRETERAYVELRARDDGGGESIVTAIFSYRTTSRISKHELKQDIVRKARHMRAGATIGCVTCPIYPSK